MLPHMPKASDGYRTAVHKMCEWLDYQGAQLWLSHQLGVGQSTVSRWTSGSCVPEAHFRQAIEVLSKGLVTFDDWYTRDELELAHRFDSGPKPKKVRHAQPIDE